MKSLSADDIKALRAFLASDARPEGTFNFHELQGFLFTIASSPETIQPSEWIPFISNDEPMGYATLEEAQETLERLMRLYNEINAGVLARSAVIPSGCVFRDNIFENFDEDAPVSQWSRGFVAGHNWLADVWEECLPEPMADELGTCLMLLSFFSSRALAEGFLAEMDTPKKDAPPIEEFAQLVASTFPDALAEYAAMGRTIFEVGMEIAEEHRHEPARSSEIGRNEPCPCGSGKKYKKCCGPTEH